MGAVIKMKSTDEKTGGNFFRAWRKWHNNMKLAQLAVALGKDPSWSGNLSRLERGLQKYTEDMLNNIAAVHDVKPDELLRPPPPGTKTSAAEAFGVPPPLSAPVTVQPMNADELHILYCYRRMTATSRRYVYHLVGDLQLLGDQAPDPFAMRGLVNFLPVAKPDGPINEKPENYPVPAGKKG